MVEFRVSLPQFVIFGKCAETLGFPFDPFPQFALIGSGDNRSFVIFDMPILNGVLKLFSPQYVSFYCFSYIEIGKRIDFAVGFSFGFGFPVRDYPMQKSIEYTHYFHQ